MFQRFVGSFLRYLRIQVARGTEDSPRKKREIMRKKFYCHHANGIYSLSVGSPRASSLAKALTVGSLRLAVPQESRIFHLLGWIFIFGSWHSCFSTQCRRAAGQTDPTIIGKPVEVSRLHKRSL